MVVSHGCDLNVISYKTTYSKDDKFKEVEIVKVPKRQSRQTSAVAVCELKPAYTARLPVSKAKVKDLLELCADLTIPSQYHSFYEELRTLEKESDSSDIDSESDSSDDGTTDSDDDDDDGGDGGVDE